VSSTTNTIQRDPTKILQQLAPLLTAAHNSWEIGFALLDRKLRYRFVNDALASMNRLSAKAHIRAPLRAIMAETADKVEPVFEKVFSTGKAVLQYEFSGGLPSRKEKAYWRVSYFPIFETPSKVTQVAAIVLDMTILRRIERRFAELLEVHSNSPTEKLHERDTSNAIDYRPESLVLSGLTGREVQTLKLLASGESNKRAAAILGLSSRTVESYRTRVMLKVGVHSKSELIRFAIRNHIVHILSSMIRPPGPMRFCRGTIKPRHGFTQKSRPHRENLSA